MKLYIEESVDHQMGRDRLVSDPSSLVLLVQEKVDSIDSQIRMMMYVSYL